MSESFNNKFTKIIGEEGGDRNTNLSLHETDESWKWKWRLVDLAHEQSLENHSIEIATSPPDKKTV